MELEGATITVPTDEAKAAYDEYRTAIKERREKESTGLDDTQRRLDEYDRILAASYKALAQGKTLIQCHEVMNQAGFDERGLPHLAIVRAHAQTVHVWVHPPRRFNGQSGRHETADGAADVQFCDRQRPSHNNVHDVVDLALDYRSELPVSVSPHQATVPVVPPALRPPHHLRNYHLLFEPTWARLSSASPKDDPILLKHLGGDLYVVLGAWDLTPLEQAVLRVS